MFLKKLIIFIFIFLLTRSSVYAFEVIEKEAQISAYIGSGTFSVFGYAPSGSQVVLSGIGIYDEVIASKNGYFEFNDQFLPINPAYEPCLTAKDKLGRITSPVCIPPIPIDYEVNMGPVLLPPTISLNQPDYFVGDEITLSGQSVPNTEIRLLMFVDKKVSIIPQAYAYSIPEINTQTDDKGNYSITLPAFQKESYRVSSKFKKDQDFSPSSNTLRIKVLPYWMFILVFFKYLFLVSKQRILEIIIISQIIAVGIFFTRWHFKPHKIMAQKDRSKVGVKMRGWSRMLGKVR